MEFFAGANTEKGFVSIFDRVLAEADRLYIIKGTSGCGKSTFMKTIASEAEERGLAAHRVYCSGDPDSLDAVIVPELRIAAADGTAPHVLEPKNPVLRERLIDLGAFIDEKPLLPHGDELAAITAQKAFHYGAAYRLLGAAGAVCKTAGALASYDEAAIKRAARRAVDKYAPSGGEGDGQAVFASAFTAEGLKILPCFGRAEALIPLGNDIRAAKLFLKFAAEYAHGSKKEHIVSLCATNAEEYDSLYFPRDGALFTLLPAPPCAEYSYSKPQTPARFCTASKETKKRVRELDSLAAGIEAAAQNELAAARALHGKAEEIYVSALRTDALREFTGKEVKRILGE